MSEKNDGGPAFPSATTADMAGRAMLRPERTLTERVAELERRMAQHDRDMAQHDRDIEALKRATGVR